METVNIYEKLDKARWFVSSKQIKKDGTNEFSKYDYFTPESIKTLAMEACEKTKTVYTTSLVHREHGYSQVLEFISIDDPTQRIMFELATDRPEIKATNVAQQLGGMDTYSERYLLMKVFQIRENALDFDAHDNRPKKEDMSPNIPAKSYTRKTNPILTEKQVEIAYQYDPLK